MCVANAIITHLKLAYFSKPRSFLQYYMTSIFSVDLFCKVKIVTKPFPGNDLLHSETRITIGQWQEEVPSTNDNCHDDTSSSPRGKHALTSEALSCWEGPFWSNTRTSLSRLSNRLCNLLDSEWLNIEDKFQKSTCNERRRQMGGQVVMQEELTTH